MALKTRLKGYYTAEQSILLKEGRRFWIRMAVENATEHRKRSLAYLLFLKTSKEMFLMSFLLILMICLILYFLEGKNYMRLTTKAKKTYLVGDFSEGKGPSLEKLASAPRIEDSAIDINAVKDLRRIINFSINLINYINARNATKVIAERSNRQELNRINRKRARKGKSTLNPLKPYYLVKIEPGYVDEGTQDKGLVVGKETSQGKSWELEYRVWVMGHERHFQNRDYVWIEPYIKGPKNAPWRNNRYALVYRQFRHLLKKRGDEEV